MSESHIVAPLDAADVGAYLVRRGVVEAEFDISAVEVLSGGVSADVFAVWTRRGSWVVKQALPRLRVDQEWTASPRRALTEARALVRAGSLLPGCVPRLVFFDSDRLVIVEELAPVTLSNWRTVLLAGGDGRDVETSGALGGALARLHTGTLDDPSLVDDFGSTETMVDLRINPFHRAAAVSQPQAAHRLEELAEELLTWPRALVHGDFSPKNVLARGSEIRVLDWEVAHLGNPVFDLAFLLSHLVGKAVHRPQDAALYQACAMNFIGSYARVVPNALLPRQADMAAHTAALVLARTDGKSPLPYFTDRDRDRARALALTWLNDPSTDLDEQWSSLS